MQPSAKAQRQTDRDRASPLCAFVPLSLCALGMAMTAVDRAARADQPEAVRVTAAELFGAMDLTRPGLEAVADAVTAGDMDRAAEAWAAYFRKRRKPTVHFDRKTWPAFMRREFPQVAEAMIDDARRVAGGDFSHGPATRPVEGSTPGGRITVPSR